MGILKNAALGSAIWAAAITTAYAGDAPDINSCNGIQSSDGHLFQAARTKKDIVANSFFPFMDAREKFKAGERLVVSKVESGYACVQSAVPSKRNREGWVLQSDLEILPASQSMPSTKWWLGYWNSDGSKVLFQILDKRFWASGASTWQGGMSPHFGEFEGHPLPYADGFRITNNDDMSDAPEDAAGCTVKMIAVGKYMALQDNGNCGGMNVSFSGIYSRSHARRR